LQGAEAYRGGRPPTAACLDEQCTIDASIAFVRYLCSTHEYL